MLMGLAACGQRSGCEIPAEGSLLEAYESIAENDLTVLNGAEVYWYGPDRSSTYSSMPYAACEILGIRVPGSEGQEWSTAIDVGRMQGSGDAVEAFEWGFSEAEAPWNESMVVVEGRSWDVYNQDERFGRSGVVVDCLYVAAGWHEGFEGGNGGDVDELALGLLFPKEVDHVRRVEMVREVLELFAPLCDGAGN